MNSPYFASSTISEHDVTLAIPGDLASVRARLSEAMRQVGFKVVGEQPIQAKRLRHSSLACGCSLNLFDHPTTLTVSLKQTNDVAVLATFSFEIKNYMHMTKGDRQTLSREAEAIAALATERLALAACRSCGTQISDESHFCRRCGAPLVIDVPELEVLRLTRGTRGSYHNMFVGILMMLCAALTLLPIFIVNGTRIYTPLLVIGIPFAVYGLFLLLQGLWQLHRTLNPRAAETNPVERGSIQPAANTKSLTAPAHGTSITEGTTELLFPSLPHREPEPVRRRDVDTGEINADRLM